MIVAVCMPIGVRQIAAIEPNPQSLVSQTGLTPQEAMDGWIALFDGQTTFGFQNSKIIQDGNKELLQGGVTTSEFADFELRIRVVRGGILDVAGEKVTLVAGEKSLQSQSHGRRGPIALSPELAIEHLSLKPLALKPLFNGKDLSGWDRRGRVPAANQRGAKWTVNDKAIRVSGGPEALEYAPPHGIHLFDNFVAQLVVRTMRPAANGGFFFRNEPGKTMMGYEVQLHNSWYDPKSGKHGYTTGGVDDRQQARAPIAADLVPFRMTVLAHGPHIATWVNGYQTVDWVDQRDNHSNPRNGKRLEAGTIQLQAHDPETELEFTGIWLQELP
jgi:hypothetical protein